MTGSNIFTGTLDLLILQTLDDGPLHGYAIGRSIREESDGVLEVEEGALYPALHRLEGRGWLASEWGRTETNRRAKFYRLTETGSEALAKERSRWRAHSRAVAAVLGG